MDVSKARALTGGVALVTAVLWPSRQQRRAAEDQRDGFPLSCYPMFTAKRRRTGTVVHLVGVRADGDRQVLPYPLAGTGGLNQVRRQITRAVRDGRSDTLLASVAGRREAAGFSEVRLVSGTYRYDAFFAGDRTPVREGVHAVCPVPARPVTARPSTRVAP